MVKAKFDEQKLVLFDRQKEVIEKGTDYPVTDITISNTRIKLSNVKQERTKMWARIQ